MKLTIEILSCFLVASPSVHAAVSTNVGARPPEYQRIVQQNPFRLKSVLSPSVPLAAAPPENHPDLKLTGIAASGENRSAYFMVEERGRPPRYLSLAEGKAGDGLEVVAIDVQAETVRLRRNSGWLILSLKADGVKSAEQVRHEEKRFVDEHTRAHELHQQRERERVERERVAAEAELRTR